MKMQEKQMTDMTTADKSADDDDNAQHDNVGQDIDRHDNNGQRQSHDKLRISYWKQNDKCENNTDQQLLGLPYFAASINCFWVMHYFTGLSLNIELGPT